jgi:hypothetical protein
MVILLKQINWHGKCVFIVLYFLKEQWKVTSESEIPLEFKRLKPA